MPMSDNNELKVTIVGNGVTLIFNDYSSGTPELLLFGTRELLSGLTSRGSSTDKQSEHGIFDALSQDNGRELKFQGDIETTTQSARRVHERQMNRCIGLKYLQSYTADDGYYLVKFTDEDDVLLQCYAKVVQYPTFSVLDNTDPSRGSFDFIMKTKDPLFYGQTLKTEPGNETALGTNFKTINGVSQQFPFQLYLVTPPTLTLTNEGNTDAPCVITITGPTESPVVSNITTGITMSLTKDGGLVLIAGETCTIDILSGTIVKNDDTDLSGYLSDDSGWIVIAPGQNEIDLTDASPGTIGATLNVEFRDTYK